MTKQQYREYFKKLQKYIKFTPIMEQLDIPRTLFSSFVNGNDKAMSEQRLLVIKKELEYLIKNNMMDKEKYEKTN